MSLFQKSVVLKHLHFQNKTVLQEKWQQFQHHFHNPTIQENIRNSKEEQYQGEFLIDLFVAILGYTKNPQPDFNLTTEYKNVKDSKKADGAIVINQKVTAVIELKGTNTTDLGKIETQAFGYKNNQPDCVYVITSNFEKLRFYIDNAIEHLEFNLFKLTQEEFNLLYLCLAHENISRDIARKIKNESVSQEDVITKKLYKDYSLFKRELYQNMVALNPDYEPLELFKKSQKLLDRFLFVFFAEDRNLLPTNLIFRINKEWKQLREMRIEVSLYDRYKIYFNDLNSGAKVSLPAFSETVAMVKEEHQIFAYNGGLFKPDEMLDSIRIDDAVLFTHTEKLSHYDFASEVDVNILGHIFENSLNELDETKAQLEGQEIDKTKTKRKKDGVFYTPKYITKYIVENTIGRLCIEKKAELQLVEEDYTTDKKRQKKTMQGLVAKLEEYRKWLLQLTICDPACGSGAFLNQALDFLIEEHRYVDELQAKLFGDALVLSDIENSILENNLFGVDLNDESVEIAKLSLWLRTAQPNRKLNDLNSNIKCGNSLIDDPTVAGDKAFNWQEAFPQVFAKGGFDVIVGNPPYVYARGIDNNTKVYFKEKYNCATYQIDLYILFLERAVSLINSGGLTSFIIPNTWLNNLLLAPVRKFILNNVDFISFVTMPSTVFSDANVDTVITTFKSKSSSNDVELLKCINSEFVRSGKISQLDWLENEDFSINIHLTKETNSILKKIDKVPLKFGDMAEIIRGVGVYHKRIGHSKEFIESDPFQSTYKKDDSFVPYLRGRNLAQWDIDWSEDSFISYGNWLAEPRELRFFENRRILIRKILSKGIVASYIDEQFVVDQQIYTAILDNKYANQEKQILAIICSTLMSFYFKNKFSEFDDLFPQIKLTHVKSLPICNNKKSGDLYYFANSRLQLTNEIQQISKKFQRTMEREFALHELSKKLQDWYTLTYGDFIKELSKKKAVLSLSQKAEWEDYFNQESKKALDLKNQIDKTDKEIDQMVYQLYGLSEEEIKIVESN